MTLLEELEGLLGALDAAQVDYALIGALAVAVWGSPRATKDIDLLVRREDLERARATAAACGYTLEAMPLEFKDGTEVHRVSKIDPAGNMMTVDFMLVDANLEPAWSSRIVLPFASQRVSVVSRDALIGMKARAARPQDLMDIQNLRDGDR